MKIKVNKLLNWYIYIIPIFFLLRNMNLFPNSFYAGFILKEVVSVVLAFIGILIFTVNRKTVKLFNLPKLSLLFYSLFIVAGLVSSIYFFKINVVIALKYYLFDFLITLISVSVLIEYSNKRSLYNAIIRIAVFFSIGAILQYIVLNLNIISFDKLQSYFQIKIFLTRASFILTNVNLLGLFLLISLVLSFHKKELLIKFILLAGIIVTGSRLYLFLGILIFLASVFYQYKKPMNRIILVAFWASTIVFILFQVSISSRIKSSIEDKKDPRFIIWGEVIKYNFETDHYIVGNGFGSIGTYYGVTSQIDRPVIYNNEVYAKSIKYTDNQFITIFHETGILGLLFFLLFLLSNLIYSVKFLSNDEYIINILLQFVIFIAALFGDVFFSFPILFIYILSIINTKHEKDTILS